MIFLQVLTRIFVFPVSPILRITGTLVISKKILLDHPDALYFASVAFSCFLPTTYPPRFQSPNTEQISRSLPFPFPDAPLLAPFLLHFSLTQGFPHIRYPKISRGLILKTGFWMLFPGLSSFILQSRVSIRTQNPEKSDKYRGKIYRISCT